MRTSVLLQSNQISNLKNSINMKTKTIHFFAMVLLLLLSNIAFSQLRVDLYGRIGMGTNYPNPEYKLHIKGNLLLTTYPEIPASNTTFVELKFKVGNGWPGAEIGTNIGEIAFWSTEYGFNQLYASHFYTQSDSTLKTNIVPIKSGLDMILKLKPCSYQLKRDVKENKVSQSKTYGFLAQEIEKVIPDITISAKGVKLVDYTQVIPLLVKALQEQNKLIDSLKQELNEIKNDMINCCNQQQTIRKSNPSTNTQEVTAQGNSKLFQNQPNPFTEKTDIEFEITEKYSTALIMIFDMQGTLKKTIPITGNTNGQIIVNGYELVAGMYMYSLIIDGKEIDTKRMILNN